MQAYYVMKKVKLPTFKAGLAVHVPVNFRKAEYD
jgi:hypothetical protein